MNCAIYAAAAQQTRVGGIDDSIDMKRGNVADDNLDFTCAGAGHLTTRSFGFLLDSAPAVAGGG